MSKTVMLVLADSIQCSVRDKKLRGNEIFRYKEYDQNGFFTTTPLTPPTWLGWKLIHQKIPPEQQISLTSNLAQMEFNNWRFSLPSSRMFQVFPFRCKEQIATIPFDQDLFVPLRLEGSPRERQLIEVGLNGMIVFLLFGLRLLHPIPTCWKYSETMQLFGETCWSMVRRNPGVIINHTIQPTDFVVD